MEKLHVHDRKVFRLAIALTILCLHSCTKPVFKSKWEKRKAPETFVTRFETSKGSFDIVVTRNASPQAVDRYFQLVRHHFYDDGIFYRVVPHFVAQFGISDSVKINDWQKYKVPDEPVKKSNIRGSLSFARDGKETRGSEMFINLKDNSRLDTVTMNGVIGFPAFGSVIRGMDVVDALYAGYSNSVFDKLDAMYANRSRFLAIFPKLDSIRKAYILSHTARAQYITKAVSDSLFRQIPLFSAYKDNYFSFGTALNARPSKYNSDVKYQVSIRDILWRDLTPAHLIPFITYSQLSFWNILLPSSPFGDNNYNPSAGIAKRLFVHDRLLGTATVVVEHESNGRDSIFSRAWNRVSFAFQGPISAHATLRVKAWIPFLYTDGNPDILQYYGYGEAALNYVFLPDRLIFDVTVRKGSRWDWRGYAESQLEYSPWKKFNGFFLLQWFQGYGEDLLNYNVKVSMLRIGLVLKSDHLTFP